MIKPISDERLQALRARAGGWPCTSEECFALIARLDAAEARNIANPIANLKVHMDALVEAGIPGKDIMDALVEAGVVECKRSHYDFGWVYELKPKPHVHEPYVERTASPGKVVLACFDCDHRHIVPSSLPIEWPNDES
jgi:hypothetical protein